MLSHLEMDLRTALGTCVTGLVAAARAQLEGAQVDMMKKHAQSLIEVAEERAQALAELDARRVEIESEVAAMHKYKEAHERRIELNIGGYRYHTSVQTMRRVPRTFFDVYFSGRYAQDVCNDGSIFVDRDGEHFGHILEYMRDSVVSVAETGANPSAVLLQALKRELTSIAFKYSRKNQWSPRSQRWRSSWVARVMVVGILEREIIRRLPWRDTMI
jgi:hypothetical protein